MSEVTITVRGTNSLMLGRPRTDDPVAEVSIITELQRDRSGLSPCVAFNTSRRSTVLSPIGPPLGADPQQEVPYRVASRILWKSASER